MTPERHRNTSQKSCSAFHIVNWLRFSYDVIHAGIFFLSIRYFALFFLVVIMFRTAELRAAGERVWETIVGVLDSRGIKRGASCNKNTSLATPNERNWRFS